MKVLLTGASAFTGLWFAEKLHAAGAEVVAPLKGAANSYSGVRAERVRRLASVAHVVPDCAFGGARFLDLVRQAPFDVLCHHAARVGDYRSADFDVTGAVAENTFQICTVLEQMAAQGLKAVIATGSVFEQDEGQGDRPLRAFSPYGLSKGLTWQMMRFFCGQAAVPLHKFVIANPFGPYEEPRFVSYLIKTWRSGQTADVRTPRYVRDNIHADLLALAYAHFVTEAAKGHASASWGPCGYVETQGAFAERAAAALAPRLGFSCPLRLLEQSDFSEPLIRVNSDVISPAALDWNEGAAWDGLAAYYRSPGL